MFEEANDALATSFATVIIANFSTTEPWDVDLVGDYSLWQVCRKMHTNQAPKVDSELHLGNRVADSLGAD